MPIKFYVNESLTEKNKIRERERKRERERERERKKERERERERERKRERAKKKGSKITCCSPLFVREIVSKVRTEIRYYISQPLGSHAAADEELHNNFIHYFVKELASLKHT